MANFTIQGGDSVAGTSGPDTYYIDGPADTDYAFRFGDAYIHNYDPLNDRIFAYSFSNGGHNQVTLQLGADIYLDIRGDSSDPYFHLHLDALPTGTDSIQAGEFYTVQGTAGDDQITGPHGFYANAYKGLGGNDLFSTDWLVSSYVNASIDGGDGSDTVTFATSTAGVTASTSGGANVPQGHVDFTSVEGLIGSNYADHLTGGPENNQFAGGAGNDVITAGKGDDRLDGGTGDDLLDGGAGVDILIGGDGTDTATYMDATRSVTVDLSNTGAQNTLGAGTDTISGIENLLGTAYSDTLTGDDGANRLEGGAGNDTLNGGYGDDLVIGGAGNDTMYGSFGVDTVSYADATSGVTVQMSVATAQNTGGGGTDTLNSFENLIGSNYNDAITGTLKANTLMGGAGNDQLYGEDNNDTLMGGAGNNVLDGGNGIDTVSYADIANLSGLTIRLAENGDGDADTNGGAGVSIYDRLFSVENIVGSAGTDTVTGNDQANALDGGAGNDRLVGNGGDDQLSGGAGDDVLLGGLGNDTLVGGDGADTANYGDATGGVTLDLSKTGPQATGSLGTDTLSGIENLLGSKYADTLTGDAGNNVLDGAQGADHLAGGLGNDTYYIDDAGDQITDSGGTDLVYSTISVNIGQWNSIENVTLLRDAVVAKGNALDNIIVGDDADNTLFGKAGNDTLYGEGGRDAFRFDTTLGPNNVDTIRDFLPGYDRIELAHGIFAAAGGPGQLSGGVFQVGTVPESPNAHILYDSATGGLFYDPDGSGHAAAMEFAKVTPGTTLTAADIVIV